MEKQVVNLTIFLIKEHITDLKDCLKAPDTLSSSNIKHEYGMEGTIFYCDSKRKPPRWKAYLETLSERSLDISDNASNKAILLVRIEHRIMAVVFGYGRSFLKEDCIERNFGFKVALNTINPNKMRSVNAATIEDMVVTTQRQASYSTTQDEFGLNITKQRIAYLETQIEEIGKRQDAYEDLVHIELERSLENLRRAQIRCKERFRKEILFRMKDDIKNARIQFRDLDRVMSELTYGEEKYHFVINDPRDKELAAFNQIIMDKNNVQIMDEDSLFTQAAMNEPAYEAQVDELMAKIMADVSQAAQDRSTGKKNVSSQISKYVDYRTFLEYDIVVENVITGMSVPLSQVSGDSSGGENQAPFYVAICASLLQIYRQSPNSIRLVLLDEAFNNMTSDRIEPMMKMFKAAHLQLVLIGVRDVYP